MIFNNFYKKLNKTFNITILASSCSGNDSASRCDCKNCNIEFVNLNKCSKSDVKNIKCNKIVVNFDAFVEQYCNELKIEPVPSCDCCYLHDNDILSLIEFKSGNVNLKDVRDKLHTSIDVLSKIDSNENLSKHIDYYLIINPENKTNKNKLLNRYSKKSKLLENDYGLCFLKDQLHNCKVLTDEEFLRMICWKKCIDKDIYKIQWHSKIMNEISRKI